MTPDLSFYAIYGLLLLVVAVVAPTVLYLDRKRSGQYKQGRGRAAARTRRA